MSETFSDEWSICYSVNLRISAIKTTDVSSNKTVPKEKNNSINNLFDTLLNKIEVKYGILVKLKTGSE